MERAIRKQFKLSLSKNLYESFYRLFPHRGERQMILEKLVVLLVDKGKTDKEYLEEIVEGMRE